MSPSFLLVVVWSIILPWLAVQSRSQNSVFSPVPSFQSDVERRQLSTSSRNGDVFVGAGGTLYRLSSELQQLQNVSVPGEVVALTTTADGDYLVACFTNRRCAAYNTTTLKNDVAQIVEGSADEMSPQNEHGFASTFENETLINTSNFPNNIALFTAPISGQLTLFIAFTEPTSTLGYRNHFLRRGVIASSQFEVIFAIRLEIVGGFVYNTTAYFIGVFAVVTTDLFVSTLPVGSMSLSISRYRFFTCGKALRFDAVITGISEVDGTVVVSVDGQVCSYNLATRLPANSPLINEGVTISLAINVERNLFLFVVIEETDTRQLSMEKHLFTASSSGTTLLYSIPVSSPVTALSWSPAVDYVYATVGNKVIRFPLETCSSSANCSSCVTNGDPLCGWCSVEGKCSRRSQCRNSNETMRYLTQGNQSNCMNMVVFDPLQFVTGRESVPYKVSISFTLGSPLPALPEEKFLCVFSNEERGITFNTTLSQNMSCDLTSSLPALTDIKLVTRFSLYSTLTKVFFFSVENGYTFYNCSHATSCRGCVETDGNCGWCLYDFSCTFKDCSVPSSFIILNNFSQSYNDVCPVLSPPASSDSGQYVQPVNVESFLTVYGSNLPPLIGSVQYMCKFGSRESVKMGERLNNSAVKFNEKVSLSVGVSGRENRNFELVLTNGSNAYTLDTSTGESVFVILYQCSDLALGCSSCLAQRIGTDFQCGWCGDTCVDVSVSCSTNFTTVSSGCPAPMITAISPDSGPTEGGTTLTINGTDLGTSFGDIISITVGSLTCTPIEKSYLVERSISCGIIGSSSQTQIGSVDVVVRVSRMGGADQNATTQFRFGQPRVYSVSPLYGPAAGGTIVGVRGEDLNIGNTENTTVSLVTTGSGRKRRNVETAYCAIMSISANEISCRWSNVTATMSGVVLVTVNNAMVQNNSVTYQYLNDPVYTGRTPRQTIGAGGIKLTFTGQYLNVSQQSRLQFNNHGEIISNMCQQSSSGTTLVCIAPPLSVLNSYTVVMDAAPGPPDNTDFHLDLVDNPVAKQLRKDSRTLSLGVNDSDIYINGQHITNVVNEEITVMVGRDQCVVQAIADTLIICIAPQRDEPVSENVIVSFGQNIDNIVGQLEYTAAPGTAGLDTAVIAGGVTGGVVLMIFIILLSIFSPILYFYISSISKYKQEIEIAQQSSIYTFIPSGDDVIEMKDNIVYLRSAPELPEANHIYEGFSGDDSLTSMVDPDDPAGAVEQPMDDKSLRDEDGYYVNDDLFPEEYRMGNTPEKTTVRKAKEGADELLSNEANSTANAVTTKKTS